MHRSGSLNRSLDVLSVSISPSQLKGSAVLKSPGTVCVDLLPRYRKSADHCVKIQTRFNAEHAVHLIPVVLLLCAFVLWLCTQPGTHAVSSVLEGGELVAQRVEDTLKETRTTLAGGLMNAGERTRSGSSAENVSQAISVDR